MDRRLFTTGLAAGTISYFSGNDFARAVPFIQPNDQDEERWQILRRLDLGALGDLSETLPRLIRRDIGNPSGVGRDLLLIETPPFLIGTRTPLAGPGYIIDLGRDLVTWDYANDSPPAPEDPGFSFQGNVRLSGDPALVVQRVGTDVTVRNGASVVIGGLIHDLPTQGDAEDIHTPVIGDLPVIGHLFRQRGATTFRRNLLIFITPRIVAQDG